MRLNPRFLGMGLMLTTLAGGSAVAEQEAPRQQAAAQRQAEASRQDPGTENAPGVYRSTDQQLSFHHPSSWTVSVRGTGQEDDPNRASSQVIVSGTSGEQATITLFKTGEPADRWIARNKGIYPGLRELPRASGTLDGRPLFFFPATEYDLPVGATVVVQGGSFVYEIGLDSAMLASPEGKAFLNSLRLGLLRTGPAAEPETRLPDELFRLGAETGTRPGRSESQIAAQQCCNETDPTTNPYPCCGGNTGNCTWKAEEQRAGDNNFAFCGPGRNAHVWMALAYRCPPGYAQGGTIPAVGAVMVFGTTFGTYGHVATVTAVNADGSIQVIEQNWCATCTRYVTYSTAQLRSHLHGYIYRDGLPSIGKKDISPAGETLIDDYNFSNVYHFRATGPGHETETGARGWGTGSAGSYNNYMHFTRTQTGATSVNWGRWSVNVLQPGTYEIQVYVPNSDYAGSTRAVYTVNSMRSQPLNQSANKGRWIMLRHPGSATGYWSLPQGIVRIDLKDNYDGVNPESNLWMAFDAIKIIRR